ncbi:hypothetical protein [Pedobacter sp. UYP1]|uniref:hypothetical protein n=1 Tax=Pedobacter sp. UYP1 TaxID=1756396 RepID=UPI0033938D60
MKNNKTLIVLTIVSSIILFILTMTQFWKLFGLLLPEIENLKYNSTSLTGQFRTTLFFSAVIGLAPILLYLTWLLASVRTTKNRIVSIFIVFTFMIISTIWRQQTIKSAFTEIPDLKTQSEETVYSTVSIENLNFEYYLLGGLILGCMVSYLITKNQSIPRNN